MSWPRQGHINLLQALTALRKAVDALGKDNATLKKELTSLRKDLTAVQKLSNRATKPIARKASTKRTTSAKATKA